MIGCALLTGAFEMGDPFLSVQPAHRRLQPVVGRSADHHLSNFDDAGAWWRRTAASARWHHGHRKTAIAMRYSQETMVLIANA